MKIPRPIVSAMSSVLVLSILAPNVRAQTQYLAFGAGFSIQADSSRIRNPDWAKHGVSRDRLDSIYTASANAIHSKDGKQFERTLLEFSKTDPKLKAFLDLETKITENQKTLAEIMAKREQLASQIHSAPSKLQSHIKKLDQQILELKRQNTNFKKAKTAQFTSKIIGATLTAITLYFQVQAIKDAIRRVQIKEVDLAARKESLLKDGAKMEVLERKYNLAKSSFEAMKSDVAAGAAELALAEQLALDAFHEVDQWQDVMKRSQQKILDAEETAWIDERTVFRQKLFAGITAVGTLVIGLFGDKIILKIQEWIESDDPADQERAILSFLDRWNVSHRIIEASMLPTFSRDEVTPLDRSAIYFMSSEELGVKHGVLERALLRFKRINPTSYASLQATAEYLLSSKLSKKMKNLNRAMFQEKRNQEYLKSPHLYMTPIDNTYVAKPVYRDLKFLKIKR